MNVVIITGASSGIGMEFAFQMDNYFDTIDEFWLVARSRERLEEVAKALKHKTRVLAMDITDEKKLDDLEDLLIENTATVRMLINAAGFGIMGPFSEQDRATTLQMVRLNCEALTNVTHCCIPFMRKNSRIIQLASSAAFVPQPGFAVYAASKSYVNSFSLALRQELKSIGIQVTSVCPGPVDTPFFDRAESTGSIMGVKKYLMVKRELVVKKALRDACLKRPKSVYSYPIQAFEVLCKLVPHSILVPLIHAVKLCGKR